MDTKEEKGGNKVPPSNSNDIVSCNEDGAHDDDDVPPTLIDLSRNDDKVSSSFASATPQLLVRKEPCPLTILSGFLGAGKTTLIQYILQSPDHGKRIAVIENEYGGDDDNKSTDTPNEITNSRNLRVESLIAQDGLALQDEDVKRNLLDMIELPNGCVCCTVKDKLVQTLEALLQARPDLDYILLECSGMANPGPLATTFWLDDALESQLRLDGIVTLVDAKYIEKQLDTTIEASQQIAYADRILINKADLFVHNENTKEGTDPLHRVQERILRLNPLAEMKTCTYSRIPDLSWILDAQLFDPNRFDATISLENEHDHCHDHNHVHDNDFSNDCEKCAHNHAHTDAISTITLHYDGCIQSLDVLNRWLAELLWPDQDGHSSLQATATSTNTMSILRLKGIVAIPNHREHYIVQAVYDTWQVTPAKTATFATDADKACQLIVIGKHLDETMLRAGFQNCLAWYEK